MADIGQWFGYGSRSGGYNVLFNFCRRWPGNGGVTGIFGRLYRCGINGNGTYLGAVKGRGNCICMNLPFTLFILILLI